MIDSIVRVVTWGTIVVIVTTTIGIIVRVMIVRIFEC